MRQYLYRIEALALRALFAATAVLPFRYRREVIAFVGGLLARIVPQLRNRARENLKLIWPDMPVLERDALIGRIGANAGRTLAGIWFPHDFAKTCADLEVQGPGAATLREAAANRTGAIIIVGHFGQWEALRHILNREGIQIGGLYRPNNNPYYDPIFRAGLEAAGKPIIPKGPAGARKMLRFIRGGGIMAILPDQHIRDGEWLDFMGQPALTSLSPAELALRYKVPLVAAFMPVVDGKPQVTVEAPIPPTDAPQMMQIFNDRLGAWITKYPDQWLWFHRRWKFKPRRGLDRPDPVAKQD